MAEEEDQEQVEQPQEEEVPQSGEGKFKIKDEVFYEGQWKLYFGVKKREGQGILYYSNKFAEGNGNEIYKGSWKDDQPHGQGTYCYTSGAVYKGEWVNGKHEGQGTYEFPNGCFYVGEWKYQKMHGQGLYIDQKGVKWEGIFVDGVYQSKQQRKLRLERVIKKKESEILESARPFFTNFCKIVEETDKKTLKDALAPYFIEAEELEAYLAQDEGEDALALTQIGDKKIDDWGASIEFVKDFEESRVLKHQSESKNLKPEQLKRPQFKGSGQIVEFKRWSPEQSVDVSLMCKDDNSWVIVYFKEEMEEGKGKKKK